MVGHWKLDDGDGLTAIDSSGNGNNGTLTGGGHWVNDLNGGALSFNGTDSYVVVPTEVIDSSLSYTVASWVRLDRTSGWRTLISQDVVGASSFYLQLDDQSHTFALNICKLKDASCVAGPDKASARSTTPPMLGIWYHVAGVHDRVESEISVYVNGALEGSAPHVDAWRGGGALVIGRARYGGNPVDVVEGTLDDVRAYQRALSSAEILELYQRGR